MDTKTAINIASKHLESLSGHVLDLLTISSPISTLAAVNLSKMVSKLSPLLGNLIELNVIDFLNQQKDFTSLRKWIRQDPGFPDTIFEGPISPAPEF